MKKNPKVIISPLQHRGEKRIKVVLPYEKAYIEKIKQIEGRKWSRTHGCWHVPYAASTWQKLKDVFGKDLEIDNQIVKQNINTPSTKPLFPKREIKPSNKKLRQK